MRILNGRDGLGAAEHGSHQLIFAFLIAAISFAYIALIIIYHLLVVPMAIR